MIHPCSCTHPDQDKMYGKGNRVMNFCKPKEKAKWVRCTVCGKEYQLYKAEEKEKDKRT